MIELFGLATVAGYAPFMHTLYTWPRMFVLGIGAFTFSQRAKCGPVGFIGFGFLVLAFICSMVGADFVVSTFGMYGTANNGIVTICGMWALYAGLSNTAENRDRFARGLELGLMLSAAWCLRQILITGLEVRAFGFIGSPVYLGAVLVVVLPILLAGRRWVGVVCTAFMLWACGTRSAYIGAAVGLAWYAVSLGGRRLKIIAGAIILFSAFSVFAVSLKKANSDRGRILVYEATWKGIKERPLFGWGPEGSYFIYQKYKDQEWSRVYRGTTQDHAHNSVLDAVATIGIFGGFLFVAVWLAALYGVKQSPSAVAAFLGLAAFSMFNPVGLAAKTLIVSVAAIWDESPRKINVSIVASSLAFICLAASFRTVLHERLAGIQSNYLGIMRVRAGENMRVIFPVFVGGLDNK